MEQEIIMPHQAHKNVRDIFNTVKKTYTFKQLRSNHWLELRAYYNGIQGGLYTKDLLAMNDIIGVLINSATFNNLLVNEIDSRAMKSIFVNFVLAEILEMNPGIPHYSYVFPHDEEGTEEEEDPEDPPMEMDGEGGENKRVRL